MNPAFIDTLNRPVLAQRFQQLSNGEKLTVAVNHLKSKGSACSGDPDTGDGQGNCNQTRRAAAQAEIAWLATDPTGSHDHDPVIVSFDLYEAPPPPPVPTCNGLTATVYVGSDGRVVGGPLAGTQYGGLLLGGTGSQVIVGTKHSRARVVDGSFACHPPSNWQAWPRFAREC